MNKRVLLTLAASIIISACDYNPQNEATAKPDQTAASPENTAPAENIIMLVCDNGYAIKANYHTPDEDGIMSKLSLEINKDAKIQKLDMIPAVAASGAKFETLDQKTSFWEHNGEFTLAIDDKDLSVCKESRKEEEFSTQTGKLFIVKEDNTASASLSKITVTGKGFTDNDISIELNDKDPISSMFLEDLNQDGFEELYITTTSVGTGSYGTVYGFASNKDQSISQIILPPVTEVDLKKGANFEGYQGSDDFYADNNQLIREFPIYMEKDSKDSPTGGRKVVYYTLQASEPTWQLNIVKSEKTE